MFEQKLLAKVSQTRTKFVKTSRCEWVNPYANFANMKWRKKAGKWLKPWHMGTHLRVLSDLSNEYQHDRVLMVYKNLCMLVFWTKVVSNAGLINVEYESQAPSIYHRIGQPSVFQCKSFTLQYLQLDIKTHTGPNLTNRVKITSNLAFYKCIL